MFSSIREQSLSRRSRSFGVIKSGRSSKLSLLSGITAASSGSNGSASTVTQDSYARIRNHPARARRKRKSRDSRSSVASREERALKQMLGAEKKRSVDVFEFLVNDSTGEKAGDAVASRRNDRASDDAGQESEPEGYYRSHVSDSGISVGGGSSIGDYPTVDVAMVASPSPFLGEPVVHPYPPVSSSAECPYCEHENQMMWALPPERIEGYGQIDGPLPQVRPGKRSGDRPKFDRSYTQDLIARPPSLDPESLIIKDEVNMATMSLPAYRGFKRLNARLLLQMQANLVELENELKRIDDSGTVDDLPSGVTNKQTAKSKSRHVHGQDNSLLRAKLQREIEKVLSQYYHALTMTRRLNEISTASSPATQAELTSWLTANVQSTSQATSILSDELDLISIIGSPTGSDGSSSFVLIALFAFIDTLIPLMIFKFVTGVLNRLIVWTLVIATGALVLAWAMDADPDRRLDLRSRNVQINCTIAFGGISLGAALFL